MAAYREHGFRGILTKPFTMEELREALDRPSRDAPRPEHLKQDNAAGMSRHRGGAASR